GRQGLNLLTLTRPISFDGGDQVTATGPPVPRPGRTGAAPGSPSRGTPIFIGLVRNLLQAYPTQPGAAVRWGPDAQEAAKLSRMMIATGSSVNSGGTLPTDRRQHFDPAARQKRQFDQLVTYTQKLWRDSESTRNDFFWKRADSSSPEKWQKS